MFSSAIDIQDNRKQDKIPADSKKYKQYRCPIFLPMDNNPKILEEILRLSGGAAPNYGESGGGGHQGVRGVAEGDSGGQRE